MQTSTSTSKQGIRRKYDETEIMIDENLTHSQLYRNLRTCSECHYEASSPSHLRIHMRKHTGEKPYFCSFCPYRCTKNSAMKTHLVNHDNSPKKFPCPFCSYASNNAASTNTHIMLHKNQN